MKLTLHSATCISTTEHIGVYATPLFHCVLYINQMYTVSYFEVHCDDGIPEATCEYFNTYHEAQAYAKSFDDWDDVRVDYLQVNTEHVPF